MIKKTINREKFAERLTEILDNSTETTYTIGEAVGLSAATISRYANGKMSPKIPTIEAIANFLNVNALWLMGFDVPMERNATPQTFNPKPSNNTLSSDEQQLIDDYRSLTPPGKEYIKTTMSLAKQQYNKQSKKTIIQIAARNGGTDGYVPVEVDYTEEELQRILDELEKQSKGKIE